MEQAEFAAGHLIDIEVAINSLLLKRKQQHGGVEIENETKCRMYYTTMLSPSVFLPVSLR